MKRVSKWFKMGLVLGFLWVILGLIDLSFKIFGEEATTATIGFQLWQLGYIIIGLFAKFFLLGAAIFYLLEKVMQYDREVEANKNKFDFELSHLNKDGTIKDC